MKLFMPLVLLAMALPAMGEVVHLNDGTSVEGELHRTAEGWTVTTADGKVTQVASSQVKSIEFKKSGPAETPEQKLDSLRRAVANQSDVRRIIDRFRVFIAQNPNTPAAKDAAGDLATWQERLDKGMVKAGDQWLTREQVAELRGKSIVIAQQASAMIAAGKLADAAPILDKALAASPQDPSLLYLKALIEYRQNHIVPARNDLQTAQTTAPDSASIHNNIAVILWKQRAQMQALKEYDAAMLAKPQDQTILDNVHEALHALSPEYKDKDLTKHVKEHFAEQDTALQQMMATKGLHRWGSAWLDQKEYGKLEAQRKAVQDKIDSMQREFDSLQAAIMKIERDIVNDQQVMQALASSSVQMDPTTGRTYQLPLPQRYYDLQRDIANLKSQKVLDQKQMEDLRKFALQQKQNMPVEKYSGVFKSYDVDGMPGAPASPPVVSAPTTAPAKTAVSGGPPTPPSSAPTTKPASNTGGMDFAPPPRSLAGTH